MAPSTKHQKEPPMTDHIAELNKDLTKASNLFEQNPQTAEAYALVGIARGLQVIAAELRGIRNELAATRLSQP
jgi:hypothetical protein